MPTAAVLELRVIHRTTQASAEHQAGRLEQAEALFREAERLQAEDQPEYPLLYSLRGYRFCDLLLARGEAAEVQRRARILIDWDRTRATASLLDIALNHLSLGRAALALGDLAEAQTTLHQSVDGLRAAGTQDHLPKPSSRAAFHRTVSDYPRAEKDLRAAEKIAKRGGMRLHLTDCHLEWARLHLARQERSDAQTRLAQARKLIAETGYHRRDQELADLEQQCAAL